MDLTTLSISDLLRLHADIAEQLLRREVTTTMNNPTGDVAEYLFCTKFNWERMPNSNSHVDAIDHTTKKTYQIKGRRDTGRSGSRELGAIRDLSDGHFDFLAAVIFKKDFGILHAVIIPRRIIGSDNSTFVKRTNSTKFILSDKVLEHPEVRHVTRELEELIQQAIPSRGKSD